MYRGPGTTLWLGLAVHFGPGVNCSDRAAVYVQHVCESGFVSSSGSLNASDVIQISQLVTSNIACWIHTVVIFDYGWSWRVWTSKYVEVLFVSASISSSSSQASGVTVSDEVIKVFNDMKVRKSSTSDEVKKRKKAALFCLSDDRKKIVVEEGKYILVGDIGDSVDDPYACFVKLLPLNDCRYGLYDATYETKESKKEDLVFIFWYVVWLAR